MLGHLAVQILRALTVARVIALDVSEDKLTAARPSAPTRPSCTTSRPPKGSATSVEATEPKASPASSAPTVDTAGAVGRQPSPGTPNPHQVHGSWV